MVPLFFIPEIALSPGLIGKQTEGIVKKVAFSNLGCLRNIRPSLNFAQITQNKAPCLIIPQAGFPNLEAPV
jgi:hypothetical protein